MQLIPFLPAYNIRHQIQHRNLGIPGTFVDEKTAKLVLGERLRKLHETLLEVLACLFFV
jgi:hypothetical protein